VADEKEKVHSETGKHTRREQKGKWRVGKKDVTHKVSIVFRPEDRKNGILVPRNSGCTSNERKKGRKLHADPAQ